MAYGSPLDIEIGSRVEAARVAAGLTQEELYTAALIAQRTYARLIRGEAHWVAVDIARIADLLDVKTDVLWPATAPAVA